MFARFAAFESAQRGPPQWAKKITVGGVCSGGGARRVRRFGVLPTARSRALAIGSVAAVLIARRARIFQLFILGEINERELRRALSFCPMLCA